MNSESSSNQKISKERVYFESQKELFCGKHALNNLLQGEVFSEEELNRICEEMAREEEMLEKDKIKCSKSGNYESAVLVKALTERNLGVTECYRYTCYRNCLKFKSDNRFIGFLFNLGGYHWTAMNCTSFEEGNLYLDSTIPLKGQFFVALNDSEALKLIKTRQRFWTFAVFDTQEAARAWERRLLEPAQLTHVDVEESPERLETQANVFEQLNEMEDTDLLSLFHPMKPDREEENSEISKHLKKLKDEELVNFLLNPSWGKF